MKTFIKKFLTSTVAILIIGKLLEKYESKNSQKIANSRIQKGIIFAIKKFFLNK